MGKTEPGKVEAEVSRLMKMNYSIHYHVWDPPSFLDLLRFCRKELAYPLLIERSVVIGFGYEIVVILRKSG